jgi:hypothetical protein
MSDSSFEEFSWVGDDLKLPATVWLNTLHRTLARHVRAPIRSAEGEAGSQHPKFEIHNSPVGAVEHKCLEAGLQRMPDRQSGGRLTRQWKGQGPYTAYKFCRVNLYKPLGQGSGTSSALHRPLHLPCTYHTLQLETA